MYSRLRTSAKELVGHAVQGRRVRSYLDSHAVRRLNIGSSYNILDGWLNVDLIGGLRGPVFMDAGEAFPLETESFDAVLCEHMIEHVPKPMALHVVNETFRVLKRGGVFRVITPDISTVLSLLERPDDPQAMKYCNFVRNLCQNDAMTTEEIINAMFHNYGHQHIYSVVELEGILKSAGFVDIVAGRGGFPHDPIFEGAEGHPGFMGFENNAFEAFALEGRKA